MKIYINNLTFKTIIGVLDFERVKPQEVSIDFECKYNYNGKYLNYAEIANLIQSMVVQNEYEILEDALINLTETLKEKFKNIETLKLKITKPDIINNAKVGVEYEI